MFEPNESELAVAKVLGWELTNGTGYHHAGDVMSPNMGVMVEVKFDLAAQQTGNILLEVFDLAHHWMVGRDGSATPAGRLADGDIAQAVVTGVRKTTYLSRTYGWASVYVHFTAPNEGVVYSSDDACRVLPSLLPAHRVWNSDNSGRMFTTGVRRRIADMPEHLRFTSIEEVPTLVRQTAAARRISEAEWNATGVHTAGMPTHFGRAPHMVNVGGVQLIPAPKCGLNPYHL